MVEVSDGLWDFAKDQKRKAECLKEWGIAMSEGEKKYYEDQGGPRLMECDKGVDPVWYTAMMKKQRERERLEQYKLDRDKQR